MSWNEDDFGDSDVTKPPINDDSDEDPLENGINDLQAKTEYLEPENNYIAIGALLLVKVYGWSEKKTYRNIALVQKIITKKEGKRKFELLGLKNLEKFKKFQIQDGDEFIADMSDIFAISSNLLIQDDIDGRINYLFKKVIYVF